MVSKFTEREVVTKIAAKFAESLMESIDLIFDMLIEPGSFDSNRISKQRFKDYALSITDQLKDQEVDILLKTHQLLQGKDYIELGDFRAIFEVPVQQAKQKKLEELAARDQTYRQATQCLKQGAPFGGMTGSFGAAQLHQQTMNENSGAAATITRNPFLDQSINMREGQERTSFALHDFLQDKVYFVVNKFREVTRGAPAATFEQFRAVFGELLNGIANQEQELGSFWSKHNQGGVFYYAEELMNTFGAGSQPKPHTDAASYRRYLQKVADPRVLRIKEKLQQHLLKNDLSLENLFMFIDKDRSKTVTIEEMSRGLSSILQSEEIIILFDSIDEDRNKILTYEELISACAQIQTSYVVYKMRQAILGGTGQGVKQVFQSVGLGETDALDIIKFEEVVRLSFDQLSKKEIDNLFRHFDRRGVGQVTMDELNRGLTQQVVLEDRLKFSLHDFITPLQTLARAKNLAVSTIFDLFAKGSSTLNLATIK